MQTGRHRRLEARGTTTGDAQKIKQLQAEVRKLKRANEILLVDFRDRLDNC